LAAALLLAQPLILQARDASPAGKPQLRILSQKSNALEIEITFPPLEFSRGPSGSGLRMGSLPCTPDAQGYELPTFAYLAPGRISPAAVRVLQAKTSQLPWRGSVAQRNYDYLNAAVAEGAMAKPIRRSRESREAESGGSNWVQTRFLGNFRGIPLTAIQFRPVRWDPARREVSYLTSLRLRLEFEGSPKGAASLPRMLRDMSLPMPARLNALPPPPAVNSSDEMRLKIYLSQEGIYHLSAGDLGSWGVNLGGEDPRTIRLENRGQEIPIYVAGEADGRFDEGDYIEFWGEKLQGTFAAQNPEIYSDLYTDANAYWLSWGGNLGERLVHESGEIVETNELRMFRAISYPFLIHQEQNSYYNRLSQVGPDSLKDHWYFDSGVQASETRDYAVYLPYPDDDALINARLRINLQGLTYPDASGQGGQHHIYVSLNDESSSALEAGSSGASWWVGQTGVILDAQGFEGINSTVLTHGLNAVSLFVPVDTDAGPNDTVLLNWYEITYQRLYRADADQIKFSPPDAAVDTLVDYRIEGFTTPQIDVFKIGQSKVINCEILPYQQNDQTLFRLHFQDRPYGSPQYIALAPSAKLLPDSTQLDEGSDLLGQLGGSPVALLIIAHRLFDDDPALEDFIARKQAAVGRTELIFMDDVFDEFSFGIYDPQAVRNLLQAMPEPPQYLLLVGDASYDTRNVYGMGGNLLAAPYVQTKAYGAVASDFWYGLLDDDLIPDLAVGRISCRDEEELSDYLGKLEEYETNPEPGAWRSRHLFVSGTGGVPELTFLQLSQQVISLAPHDVLIERLATDPITSPFYGGTTDLIDLFDEGALVMDYNGHGAGAVWSDNSLFRLENLPQLSNQGRYPFVTNFTCFIGAFDTPGQGTILGEEFIFEPEKGAIAVLGSTGLGWLLNGGWLQEELIQVLYAQPDLCLGDLINLAKMAYYAYYGYAWPDEAYDMIHLMSLLGDPTLKLALAPATAQAEVSPQFIQTGDSVHVQLPGDYENFDGLLRIYEENDYPAMQFGQTIEVPLAASAEGLSANFIHPALSDSIELGGGTYRLTFWNPTEGESYRSAGSFYLSDAYVGGLMVDSLAPDPNPVYARDSFGFRAKIIAAEGVAEAYAHFHIAGEDSGVIVPHDSLLMALSELESWHETASTIDSGEYHFDVGDSVSVWVKISDEAGDTVSSEAVPFFILDSRPDPAWVDDSLKMGIKQNAAAIIMQVVNLGETEVDSLDVSFFLLNPAPQLLGSSVIRSLMPDSVAEAWIPSALSPGTFDFQVRMNDSGWVDDKIATPPYTSSLLIDHFTITQQEGSADTLSLGEHYEVYLPPGSLSAPSGVILLHERTDLEIPAGQQGLSFALQDSSGFIAGSGIEIGLLNGLTMPSDSLYLAADWTVYDEQSAGDVAWHWRENSQPFYRLIESNVDTLVAPPNPRLRYWAKVRQPGSYAVMQNEDHQGPTVEITVEGQIYTPGGYVPSQPKLSAIVQDLGGVSSLAGSYAISLDGETVDSSEITLSLESTGQVLTLSINPTLSVDDHTLTVTAQDLFGNVGSASIDFQVAGQFHLDFVGNYPNPFKDQTYFAYRLSEQTTEPVQIRIYTVSGRLIRTLYSSSSQEINYGEIYWDGRDEDGSLIANGVYFYKFIARRGDQEIERTMKLAKLIREG
jgi:hypothetical protein